MYYNKNGTIVYVLLLIAFLFRIMFLAFINGITYNWNFFIFADE